uniref:Phospholipase A2-like central domain-containing protein n=1 Tax=Maylandia zebra TaxID=106582 RepID=A0A3P9CG55_9CICH
MLTESWLTSLTPDTSVTLPGFQLLRADRTRDSGKRKGGGLAVFVNDRWCNPGHITVKEQLCSRDIELLAVSMLDVYLWCCQVHDQCYTDITCGSDTCWPSGYCKMFICECDRKAAECFARSSWNPEHDTIFKDYCQ